MSEPSLIALQPWAAKQLNTSGVVIGTRCNARKFLAAHADRVNPAVAVYIDCRGVMVISSPWLSEVLDAWPYMSLVGANEDVQETWDVLLECRAEAAQGPA